jgi:mono/diheme cytochrome c family protein
MDFPVFHLDFFGNRVLIGVIAVLHVYINHAMAVGAIPFIALMEWWGHRTGDERWDRLAYRILFVCFIVTTSVGALTGVGIWLSSALVNPAAIGSLIRVFFWAWFTEWIVFVTEVVLILIYFLTWKQWTGPRKVRHIAVGFGLAAASWATMAIIVAILGFMMDSGVWTDARGFLDGVLNPIYLPQLAFRTPFAMVAAGFFGMLLIFFFQRGRDDFRPRAVRFAAVWTLAWTPLLLVGGSWYWSVIPDAMRDNIPVAITTQAFTDWYQTLFWIIHAASILAAVVMIWGAALPRTMPRAALVIPFAVVLMQLGYFERVREFIRKPEVIGRYMYSNGIRKADYPLLREKGVLELATFTPVREITPENRLIAGRELFRLTCTRCHTSTQGVNAVTGKLVAMYGAPPWDEDQVRTYVRNMHNTRPYMPPFPGTDAELGALAAYLVSLPDATTALAGAQLEGVSAAPRVSEQ